MSSLLPYKRTFSSGAESLSLRLSLLLILLSGAGVALRARLPLCGCGLLFSFWSQAAAPQTTELS